MKLHLTFEYNKYSMIYEECTSISKDFSEEGNHLEVVFPTPLGEEFSEFKDSEGVYHFPLNILKKFCIT